MNIKKWAKKGVAGLEFMKAFAVTLFVVVIIFFALAIAGASLSASTTNVGALALINNFTTGLVTLGTSIPTWISLAAIVVLIGIIVVIIVMVQGIQTQGGGRL